jgi:ATP-dependent exoDNAse (exonuclease V) beta subunit
MAISEQQRAILIERLKKAQEAKRAKAAARKAEAEQPKPERKAEPKAEPKPKAPKVEKVEKREIEEKVIEKEEIEHEEPVAAQSAQEIYAAPHARSTAYIQEEEEKPKKSKPMNIPEPKPVKAAKEKGYMKLKFYKEPTARVMKKLMSLHEESSSDEEEESPRAVAKPPPVPQPTREDAKKAYMKQMANYMFDYY